MSHERIINSAIATGVAEIATLPLCTTKTVYQNTQASSIASTVKYMYRQNGIITFYQASLPAIGSQMFSTSTKYVFYRKFEDLQLPYTNKVTNGIMGGMISSAFTHPVDVVKVHWQMNDSYIRALRSEGAKLIYRGYSKTLSKVIVGSALFFPLTDYYRSVTKDNILVSSFLSGLTSTLGVHPIDYLKTRHIYNQPLYQGLDIRTYYKGLSLNILRVVPHFMIVMSGIDLLEQRN